MIKPSGLLFISYQFIRQVRYSILQTMFGHVSHCPHTPTCGTRLLHNLQKKQYNQIPQSLKQLINCY